MIKTLMLFILILFEGLILKSQVIVNSSYNYPAKKIDKKISVISNIPNPGILGFVPSDIPNDRQNLKPSDEVNKWMQSFLYKQFDTSTVSKGSKLLWVIQDLSLGKDSEQNEVYSFVKIKVDIYDNSKHNNEDYQMINTFDSIWIVKSTTANFGEMICAAFTDLYENSTKQKNTSANKRFLQIPVKLSGTKEDITKQLTLSKDYTVLKDSTYTSGVYLSFNEFKNNSPVVKQFYTTVDSSSKKVKLFEIMPDSSSRLIVNAWGASISNELYFYSGEQLFPIEKAGNTFYLAKYLDFRTRRNQALYWRMYIGRKQGDVNPYNDKHILKRSVAEKNIPLAATHLDFDFGDFTY